jgi:hypothetical protein
MPIGERWTKITARDAIAYTCALCQKDPINPDVGLDPERLLPEGFTGTAKEWTQLPLATLSALSAQGNKRAVIYHEKRNQHTAARKAAAKRSDKEREELKEK